MSRLLASVSHARACIWDTVARVLYKHAQCVMLIPVVHHAASHAAHVVSEKSWPALPSHSFLISALLCEPSRAVYAVAWVI